jgi:hypothetical protein
MVQSTKKAQRGGAPKWTLNHLPFGTSTAFTESLVPLAKIKAGTLDAWEGLSPQLLQPLVDVIYPGEGHIVEDDDVWGGLVRFNNIFSLFHLFLLNRLVIVSVIGVTATIRMPKKQSRHSLKIAQRFP